jgi:replication-associated recombination protein RarA
MAETSLFRGPLTEQYRPKSWADVVGQDKLVQRIQGLAKRGLAGRAYWLSGQSGTGKTTIGRLIAAEVADEICIEEVDAVDRGAAPGLRARNASLWMGGKRRPRLHRQRSPRTA